jgi:hypothetical protein
MRMNFAKSASTANKLRFFSIVYRLAVKLKSQSTNFFNTGPHSVATPRLV